MSLVTSTCLLLYNVNGFVHDVKNNQCFHLDLDRSASTLLFGDSRRQSVSVSLLLLLLLPFLLLLALVPLPGFLPGGELRWCAARLLDRSCGWARHVVVF